MPGMKFLLDENFPCSAAEVIASSGHVPLMLKDFCDSGESDEVIFDIAQSQEAIILTSDRDFYHTVPLLHPRHHGIVVISLRQPNRKAILERLDWFSKNISLPIDNRVYSLRDQTYCVKAI